MPSRFSGGPFGFPAIQGLCGMSLSFKEVQTHNAIQDDTNQGYKEQVYVEYNPFYDGCNINTYNNLVRAANLILPAKDNNATTFVQTKGYGSFDKCNSLLDFILNQYQTYDVGTPDLFLKLFDDIKTAFKDYDKDLLPYELPLESIKSKISNIQSFTISLKFSVQYKEKFLDDVVGSLFKSELEYNVKFDAQNLPFDNYERDYLQQQNKILFFLARALRHVQFVYMPELESYQSSSLEFHDCVIEHVNWDGVKAHYKISSFADLETAVIQIHELVKSNCVPARIRLVPELAAAVIKESSSTQPLLAAPQEPMIFTKHSRYKSTDEAKPEPDKPQKNDSVCATLRNLLQC